VASEALKHTVNECPDLETIAAYLDRRLRRRERERVTAHLADCESCYFVFSEAAQTHLTWNWAPPSVWQRLVAWLSRPKVIWGSAAATLATAASLWLVAGTAILQRVPTMSPELQALVAAVGTDRTIEPRLTGGFAYGPVRAVVRGGETPAANVPPDVRIAAAQIEKGSIAHRTPQTLESLGIADLIVGETDRAVLVLEQGAELAPADAKILSDLSAAYLARATRQRQSDDLNKALALADRAIKADPKLAEARFNRAYALEHLSLMQEARDAWQEYLKIDNQSGWAGEARQHLGPLVHPKP
jgi:tetratricopeptide (TPR) repeat protein